MDYLTGSPPTKSKGPDDLRTIIKQTGNVSDRGTVVKAFGMLCGQPELRLLSQSYAIQFPRPLEDQSCPVNLGSSGKRLVNLKGQPSRNGKWHALQGITSSVDARLAQARKLPQLSAKKEVI